jgi:homoisocitrate dehydrogenase
VQYVKQETLTQTESGKEARATRLITELASRRIGKMAFELALARPRKVLVSRVFLILAYAGTLQQVTIIHKSNVLSVTDGLFRETVRAVPDLPEVAGRFDSVAIAEQIVDSAVYRFDSFLRTCPKNTDEGIIAGSSVSQSKPTTAVMTTHSRAS